MRDIVLFVIDFFVVFSSKQKWRLFFQRIFSIFDNYGGPKVFISQNQVESIFIDHLFLSDYFAACN